MATNLAPLQAPLTFSANCTECQIASAPCRSLWSLCYRLDYIADADDCSAAQLLSHLNNSFNFKELKETTDENNTAHCSVPMLKCPADEARSSS